MASTHQDVNIVQRRVGRQLFSRKKGGDGGERGKEGKIKKEQGWEGRRTSSLRLSEEHRTQEQKCDRVLVAS